MTIQIGRRRFIVAGAGMVGGLLVAHPVLANEVGSGYPVWGLDPFWGQGLEGCPPPQGASIHNCEACHACHKHSQNKLFPTAEDANANRAHFGCKCLVVDLGTLPGPLWMALFGSPDNPSSDSADRRYESVQQAFDDHG